jgi:hypothetical protein
METDNQASSCEILGSHCNEKFDVGLLQCNAMWMCRWILAFGRNILPLSSELKMFLQSVGICLQVHALFNAEE